MPLPYDVARARIARILSVTDPDHVKKLVLEIEAGTISMPILRRSLRDRAIDHFARQADTVVGLATALNGNPHTLATVVSELALEGTVVLVGRDKRRKLWALSATRNTQG